MVQRWTIALWSFVSVTVEAHILTTPGRKEVTTLRIGPQSALTPSGNSRLLSMRKPVATLALLCLSGCAFLFPKLSPEEAAVAEQVRTFHTMPKAEYEEVGPISISWGRALGDDYVLSVMRYRAGMMGADGLIVLFVGEKLTGDGKFEGNAWKAERRTVGQGVAIRLVSK